MQNTVRKNVTWLLTYIWQESGWLEMHFGYWKYLAKLMQKKMCAEEGFSCTLKPQLTRFHSEYRISRNDAHVIPDIITLGGTPRVFTFIKSSRSKLNCTWLSNAPRIDAVRQSGTWGRVREGVSPPVRENVQRCILVYFQGSKRDF